MPTPDDGQRRVLVRAPPMRGPDVLGNAAGWRCAGHPQFIEPAWSSTETAMGHRGALKRRSPLRFLDGKGSDRPA